MGFLELEVCATEMWVFFIVLRIPIPSSFLIKCIRFVSVACFRGSVKEPRAVLVRAQGQG